MKLAFAGTPEFARVALAALQAAGHEIVLVLTQPDRPAGRGMKLQASAVKQQALQSNLPLAQPRSLRLDGKFAQDAAQAQAALQNAAPELMVVAAYGLILPAWTLALPRLGCLNIHASLLPRWRGAAPIHRAIEAGDRSTGITIMQMDAGLDTGAMLLVQAEPIHEADTTALLHDRLAALGGQLIQAAVQRAQAGTLKAQAQPLEGVTYAHKVDKAEGVVRWTEPAAVLERRLRAFDPFPGCSAELGGHAAKLWRAQVVPGQGRPGQVLEAQGERLVVACGDGALALQELQLPGGKRINAREFLDKHPLKPV